MEDISDTRTELNNNLNMEERLQSQSSTPHLHNATEDVTLLWYGDWYIYVTVVEIIMSIIILVGNGLVIAAYITDRKLRTVTNFFLVNLVIADFTVGLALPISCGIFYMKDGMSPHLCTLQFTVLAVPLGSSTLCLLLITVERYRSVVYPFHHQMLFTKMRRFALVFLSWLLATLIMGVAPMVLTLSQPTNPRNECNPMDILPSWYWCVVLALAVIVLSSIVIVYMKILSVARQQIRSIELLVLQVSLSDKKNIQNVRLARTGCILLGLFIICWLPFVLILTIELSVSLPQDTAKYKILRIARIISMVLAPASSAINPIIYPARIRRFKLRIKKLLHLTISHSDKFETYEIRQSFKVKRKPLELPDITKKVVEPVSSYDSGVGGSHSDDNDDETSSELDNYILHNQCRLDRSLSRISESPEHRRWSCSVSSDVDHPPMSQSNVANTAQWQLSPTSHTTRRVAPPHFLDLHNTTRQPDVQPIYPTLYDNVTPGHMRMSPFSRDAADSSQNSFLCTEPIVVDCDKKSEYFRLVVKRTVRDCDSDSDSETILPPQLTNSLNRPVKLRNKNKLRDFSKRHSSASISRMSGAPHDNTFNTPHLFVVPSPSTSTSAPPDRSPRILHHQKSPSRLSTGSVGVTLDNDDLQFEITDTHRASKRRNGFLQLSYASLQRRKHEPLRELDDNNSDVKSPKEKGLVKGFWDGTLKKLRKSGVGQRRSKHNKSKLGRNLSMSLDDVSRPKVPKTVHKRSRSDLDEDFSSDEIQLPQLQTFQRNTTDLGHTNAGALLTLSIPKPSIVHKIRDLVSPRQDNQPLTTSTTNHRVRLSSWSYSETEHQDRLQVRQQSNNNYTKVHISEHVTDCNNIQPNNMETPLSASHDVKDVGFFCDLPPPSENMKTNSIPNYITRSCATPGSNDVLLPVRLRLKGGGEEELLLTRQDIYARHNVQRNIYVPQLQIPTKTQRTRNKVMRKRSMSHPNIATSSGRRGYNRE